MKIAVVGLGYVGLPLALSLAKRFPGTIGFDINERRVAQLQEGLDLTREASSEELKDSPLAYTADPADIKEATIYIITVPTPVDENNNPDLTALERSSESIGKLLQSGDIVVYESTVYPGVTEDFCGKVLERASGLRCGEDFTLGYSPERINPGDKEHTLETITKVVAGQDAETLETLAEMYGSIIRAGIHKAPSIKVAEAAKVIENTQRDLNIALMNELSIIFDKMGIRTKDVLAAASTKWNFLKFYPGLVGGHCIGVDPYYLTTAAERLGYHPQVILAGRRINDGMGKYVAQRTIKLMVNAGIPIREAKIGIFGITFKENVPDTRNSKVPDIIHELDEFGCLTKVYDPHAEKEETYEEYRVSLTTEDELRELDALILAVAHDEFVGSNLEGTLARLKPGAVLVDVKSVIEPNQVPEGIHYWAL